MKRIVGLGIRHDVVRAESWKFHDAFRPKRKAAFIERTRSYQARMSQRPSDSQ